MNLLTASFLHPPSLIFSVSRVVKPGYNEHHEKEQLQNRKARIKQCYNYTIYIAALPFACYFGSQISSLQSFTPPPPPPPPPPPSCRAERFFPRLSPDSARYIQFVQGTRSMIAILLQRKLNHNGCNSCCCGGRCYCVF